MKNKNIYLSGVINMASYNLNPSYMEVDCIKSIDDFSKEYNIPKEKTILNKLNINIREIFKNLLKIEDNSIDNLLYLLEKESGKIKNIYELSHETFKLLSNDNSKYPFFFLEDMHLIEFEDITLVLMIGNYE